MVAENSLTHNFPVPERKKPSLPILSPSLKDCPLPKKVSFPLIKTTVTAPAQEQKMYLIEWFRILFIFFVILGHVFMRYPQIKESFLRFFKTGKMEVTFPVEFFFIIGGFLLYRKIQHTSCLFSLIKRTYCRLLPALLFVFFLWCFVITPSFSSLPSILFLTTGLFKQVTGWGDWFVGAYFWSYSLFAAVLFFFPKKAFLLIGIFMYFALCLRFYSHTPQFMGAYFGFIGAEFTRALWTMGLGIVASFLAQHLFFPKSVRFRILMTVVELSTITGTICYLLGYLKINFLEVGIVFSILLISTANSAGYISAFFNKIAKIQYFSRYTYSVFLGHIIPLLFLQNNQQYIPSAPLSTIVIFVGAIILGVFEYHVIEGKLCPFLKKYFLSGENK